MTASSRTVHAACPHDCPDTCALQVTVEDERVIKVQGRADHPHTHGALCTKVARYAERTHHPERLLQPLRRVSAKDAPARFEPISWDDALREIAARLQAIAARNPEAIVPYSYAGTMGLVQGEAMASRFFDKLGASRLARTICAEAGSAGLTATYGAMLGMHVRDFAQSRLIVLWGGNAIASNLHFWTYANQAKRAGAKLVCIDPRRTDTADKCHQHLALRPGTDGALALGLMRELIVQGRLDEAYIAAHVSGFDGAGGLRERALAWPPERVASECGLSVDEVRGLAHDYATLPPAAIRLSYGMQRAHGGGNAVRLIALLPCLTGAWRAPGGGLLLSASGWHKPFKRRDDELALRLLAGRTPRTINMSTLGADLLRQADPAFGPRIEALIVYNSNPAAVAPDGGTVQRGLQRHDLFTVVLEHFMTDTAEHADVILPATTQMEHEDVHFSYGHTDVLYNHPAVAPLGQSRSNAQIFRDLARAMGYTEPCFADTDAELAAQAVQGLDMAALRRQGWLPLPVPERPFAEGHFATPDGRACAGIPASQPEIGVADYVRNHECAERTPALAARYPLALITPPARHFLNSTFVNVQSLRDIEGEPLLEMHAADAAARGLSDGELVEVFNDRGSHRCRLRLNDRARRGVVHGLSVWWRKLGVDGKNINELTHDRLTDMGAAPCFHDALVEVRRPA